jgi:hypothetical protein
MNLKEIKSRLDKLNRYYEYFASTPGNISRLDLDSFLMHLRELYDAALSENSDAELNTNTEITVENIRKIQPISEKTELISAQSSFELKKEEIVQDQAEPVIMEDKEDLDFEEKIEEPIELTAIDKSEVIKSQEKYDVELDNTNSSFNTEFEELFTFKIAVDLAEKLAESPISDLNKAIGLNERLKIISSLFGGDAAKFNDAVNFFNTSANMNQSRLYMERELIEKFDWMNKERKASAKEFIKWMRRRYL